MGLRLQSQRPHDIVSIAEKLKAGSVAIRVGFWLDNEVVVFSGEKPADQKQIEMFERCITENHILIHRELEQPHHRKAPVVKSRRFDSRCQSNATAS